MMQSRRGKNVPIYLLEMGIKKIREERFETKLLMFFAGDFLSQDELANTMFLKWGMGLISVSLCDLLKINEQSEKILRINKAIQIKILEA